VKSKSCQREALFSVSQKGVHWISDFPQLQLLNSNLKYMNTCIYIDSENPTPCTMQIVTLKHFHTHTHIRDYLVEELAHRLLDV